MTAVAVAFYEYIALMLKCPIGEAINGKSNTITSKFSNAIYGYGGYILSVVSRTKFVHG